MLRQCRFRIPAFAAVLVAVCISGCGTTTKRLATEQLLISDAVDQAVEEIDFGYLQDQDVFLDAKYLKSGQGTGFANTDYIISSIREQLAAAGCRVWDERKDARIIVEPRVGALGTDGHEVTYGIPQTGQFSSAAAAIGSAPIVPAIPEISFGRSDQQQGVAKIVLYAYDKETKIAIWQSGVRKSESTSNSTWVLGAGPFQKGTIHDGYRFAGKQLGRELIEMDELERQRILANIDIVADKDQPKSTGEQEQPVAKERTAQSDDAAAADSPLVR